MKAVPYTRTWVLLQPVLISLTLGQQLLLIIIIMLTCLQTVQLEWYPIVRDCLLYVASVSVLAACISDSIVHWYVMTQRFIVKF